MPVDERRGGEPAVNDGLYITSERRRGEERRDKCEQGREEEGEEKGNSAKKPETVFGTFVASQKRTASAA